MDKRWEDLDENILDWISNLCSLRDCIRMGAVCKSWLSVSWKRRCRPQLPWLMMPSDPSSTSAEATRCFFSVSDNTILDAIKFSELDGKRCCGSFNNADARGGLMTIDDMNLEMRLFHPWRKIQLQLPHHSSLPRRYPLFDDDDPHLGVMKIRTATMSDNAKVVVIIHDSYTLAFCRIGDKGCTGWTRVSPKIFFNDVIYHKGQFYAVTTKGSVGVLRINTSPPYVKMISERAVNDECPQTSYPRTYLVADPTSERLLVFLRISPPIGQVARDPYNYDRSTSGFKVYELLLKRTGASRKNLVQVDSLSESLIFLGQNSSMIVMASQFPAGFKGNCIYFTDDYMEATNFKSPLGCVDLGVFNMEDKTPL